jgi:putative ABC transport system permease protein
LAFAGCLGIGLSLVAALIPARRAASVSPLEGMGGASADDLGDLPWRLGIIGSVLVVGGGAVLTGSLLNWYPNTFEVSSGLVILVGFVLMVPAGFRPLSRLAAWLPKRWVPTETDLARGQLLSHPIRAMLTVGILFIALVTEIALGTTILNIMHDVNQWLERTIVADFFVRAMMPDMSTGEAADVPEAVGTAIRKIPGIRRIGVVRFVSTRVDGQGVVLVAKDFPADEPLPLDLRVGSETEVRRGLAAGEVVLGSKLAARIGRTVGDEIELETKQGPHRFRIAGITNEYTLDGMAVFMDHSVAERQLGITGVDAYLISADSGALGSVEQALRKITDENGLLLQSAADVRRLVDTMMAGVVGGLWVLLALASLVAGFGVVNTLAMNVLEQTRELAILRVVAMTRRQIRHTILCQASILGSIGLLPATIVGVGMAYIMHVGTVHETSHLMNFAAHPALVLALLAIGYTIVLIAATMPAQRAARLNLLTALHYE